MDRGEQSELKQLSLWGIYDTSMNIIIRQHQIFTKIALISVLPVSFILLAFIYIFFYLHKSLSSDGNNELNYLTVDSMIFAVLVSGHLLLTLLLSSVVIYTVASIHADKDVSFGKLMRSIPEVSRRLMITFTWIFIAFSLHNLLWFSLLKLYGLLIKEYEWESSSSFPRGIRDVADYVCVLTYSGGVAVMGISWQLGSVVSVFEDGVYGRSALAKSSALINGKLLTAIPCFGVSIWIGFFVPEIVIAFTVMPAVMEGELATASLGIMTAALWVLEVTGFLVLLQVAQTVLYLVCKSNNGEEVNKALLANHLEGFVGGGIPRAAAHRVQPVTGDYV